MKLGYSIIAACVLLVSHPLSAQNAEERLTRYKAAFVYHFIDYVEWPEADREGPLKIGILGKTPLGSLLREIAQKDGAGARGLEVKVYTSLADLEACHLLFISSEFADKIIAIREHLKKQSTLTVSDTAGMAKKGVAINLVLVKGKLKFEVNRQTLENSGLQVSAQLLKLAILVDGKTG